MFRLLYDLVVFLTNNYSKMPNEFKDRFPENFLVRARLDVGSINSIIQNYDDYE